MLCIILDRKNEAITILWHCVSFMNTIICFRDDVMCGFTPIPQMEFDETLWMISCISYIFITPDRSDTESQSRTSVFFEVDLCVHTHKHTNNQPAYSYPYLYSLLGELKTVAYEKINVFFVSFLKHWVYKLLLYLIVSTV